LPYEELNRVVKERDRLAEENDELRKYRASVDIEQIQREKAELLNRYELEKREIRSYMMKQDQQLAQALHTGDCQGEYIAQLQDYIETLRLPKGRLLQIKNSVIVTEEELHEKASTFKWDLMFEDLEHVYAEEIREGGRGMQPPPVMPSIPPVQWDKDEFLARLQRHFKENVGRSAPNDPPPQTVEASYEEDEISQVDGGSSRDINEEPGVDLDGRPLPPGWTNEEHVCLSVPIALMQCECVSPCADFARIDRKGSGFT
jgi:hypothetical protein